MGVFETMAQYAERGWSVFPVGPDKRPLVAWKQYQTERATDRTIKSWTKAFPSANVGIATGSSSGVTVIDIDGPEGVAALKAAGISLPRTLTAKTPRGWHYYYQYDSSYPQTASIAEKVDIRNDGGYVIAPPSIIGGKEYTWVREQELAKAPDILSLFPRKPTGSVAFSKEPKWVEKYLKNGCGEGQRNDVAAKLAGHYRTKNLAPEETLEILKIFADRCDPPMGHPELWTTIQSVYRYAGDIHSAQITEEPECRVLGDTLVYQWTHLGLEITLENITYDHEGLRCTIEIHIEYPGVPNFRFGPENINLASSRTKSSAIKHLQSRFAFDWATIFDMVSRHAIYLQREGEPFQYISNFEEYQEQPLWFLEPFVAEAGLSLLFAKGDSGKSMLALAILMSAQSGIPILGRQPARTVNGLYLDWESNDNSLRKRLRLLSAGHGLPEMKIAYQSCSIGFPLLLRRIRKRILDDQIGFIVLDAISGAAGDDIIRQDVTAKFANAARSLKIPMLLISHTRKGGEDSEVGEAYGSVYWFNESRTVMEMRTEQEEGVPVAYCHLYHRKNNDGAKTPRFGYRVDFTAEAITFSPLSHTDFLATSRESSLSLKDRIALTLQEKDKTATEISEDIGVKRDTVRRILHRNQEHPFVVSHQGGRGGSDDRDETIWSLRAPKKQWDKPMGQLSSGQSNGTPMGQEQTLPESVDF